MFLVRATSLLMTSGYDRYFMAELILFVPNLSAEYSADKVQNLKYFVISVS